MKIKAITACFAAFAAAIAISGCSDVMPERGEVQPLDYNESVAAIDNPDSGFYRPIYVRVTENGVSYNESIVNASTRLYHLRCDISAFSAAVNGVADKPLTQAALGGLNDMLAYLRANDKNAVVRFAYDSEYRGEANKEPTLPVILQHVEQLCGVLDDYSATVTAVETGLIGPWGEMHTSAIANAEHITPIVDAFLTRLSNVPVLVRTPKMIYDYIGITGDDAEDYVVGASDNAYYLGLYNDGYLGSDTDLDTYADRDRDIAFLSGQTAHLPFGGEVTVPDSALHDIDVCVPEMFRIHLSYLNLEWDNRVIDKWKNSLYTSDSGDDKAYYGKTAFEYISNRMGYRFVIKKSIIGVNDDASEVRVELDLENVGFGNMNKRKRAALVFADGNGEIKAVEQAGEFAGETKVAYSASVELESGDYDVYLRLYGDELDGAPLYCVRFANDGLWNANIKANKIGSVKKR